jgi:hypothetical protein
MCISGLFGMGLLMTILGVDTSRLFGFTFPMILLSLKILKNKPMTWFERKTLSVILLLNLFLPSAFIFLNAGVGVDSGVYAWLYNGILHLVTGGS